MDSIQRIANNVQDVANKKVSQDRHIESILATSQVEKAVYAAVQHLTSYLASQITRTEVLNQPTSIATPDVLEVVQAVKDLSTITENKQIDLSPLVEGITKLQTELQAIPKQLPTFEQRESVEVSNLPDQDKVIAAINAIKLEPTDLSPLQKTMLEAVKAVQNIKTEQIDIDPLQKAIQTVTEAVKSITIPETKLDTSKLENEQIKQTKLLKAISEKKMGSGGGGGNGTPYIDVTGKPMNVVLNGSGAIPVSLPSTAPTLAEQLDQTDVLEEIETYIAAIASARGIAADIRVTLLSGTVTTVTTLSNQTSIGGWTASSMVPATSNTTAILSNINNIAR